MTYYEYKLILMDPFHTDARAVESTINDLGCEGFRFVGIHKLWTTESTGALVQAEYLLLEKAEAQDDLD